MNRLYIYIIFAIIAIVPVFHSRYQFAVSLSSSLTAVSGNPITLEKLPSILSI